MSLSGKKFLVTGASSSIGCAISLKLSLLGSILVLTGRDEERLNNTFSQLYGSGHEKYLADLSNIDEIEPMINQTVKSEKYSGFVHCAGLLSIRPLRMLTTDILRKCMETHFFSFVEIVRIITKKQNFEERGGSIVAMSSTASDSGEIGQTAYSAAKAAIDASVRTLSFELAPKNIRINSIRAGVMTKGAKTGISDDALISKQLLGIGSPDDVASAVVFLLSEDSRFMTGRFMYLDGGRFL